MKEIYLITYWDTNTIEGFVEKKSDFKDWLTAHNRKRIAEGEEPENEIGFKVEKILNLIL